MVTTLCAVSGFQSTVVVSLWGYATYIQPLGTAASTATIFNPVISSSHILPIQSIAGLINTLRRGYANNTGGIDTETCTIVRHEYDNAQMFEKFITTVNSQDDYNNDGIVKAIPIIVYHIIVNYPDLSNSNRPIDTTLNLFDDEMTYLHDNGFKVITMTDLGYDENNKSLYIKGT